MKVSLQEISPSGGYNQVVEMSAVPREDEAIQVTQDGEVFTVRSVIWTPGYPGYDVVVRFR